MAQKTKLSIYLIKSDCDFDSIIDASKKLRSHPIEGVGAVYYCASHPHRPPWVESFFGNAVDAGDMVSSSASALLVSAVDTVDGVRCFALAFGYGYLLINKDAIEDRFGIKTVLNSAPRDSIRRVKKTAITGNSRRSDEQMPRKSTISDFTLDVESDLVGAITATCEVEGLFSGTVTGADSLTVSADVSIGGVVEYLRKVYDVYKGDKYKEDFAWIDHMTPVRSPALKEILDKEVISQVNRRSPMVYMAVPGLLQWETVEGFRYSPSGCLYDDVLIDDVIGSLRKPLTKIDQLKSKTIYVIDVASGEIYERWSAYRCLCAEIEHDEKQFCLNGGEWYRVDKDYVKQVNESYELMPISDINLPKYGGCKNEAEYNELVASSGNEICLLMDQKFIYHGGYGSKMELCDILTSDRRFVHVKRYSGSSTLSHLFNQGLCTAELTRSDAAFVERANEVIESQAGGASYAISSESPKEVVYAIITKRADDRPRIPFFSKIALRSVQRRLNAMGVDVAIKAVKCA